MKLPTAKNSQAEFLVANIDRVLPALHPGIDPQGFSVSCVVALNKLKSDIDVSSSSVLIACFNAAKIGLVPCDTLGHVYFIPRKRSLNLEIGYKGYIELAYRNDFLRDIYTDVILVDEKFKSWADSDGPQISHEKPLDRVMERRNVLGSYCVWHSRDGGRGIAVVPRRELDKVDTQKHVWKSHYCPMAQKTGVLRSKNDWRVGDTFAMAALIDEQAQRGEPQDLGLGLPGGEVETVPTLSGIPEGDSNE